MLSNLGILRLGDFETTCTVTPVDVLKTWEQSNEDQYNGITVSRVRAQRFETQYYGQLM